MKKRYIFICVVLFAVSASVAVVQMDFSKVEIQTTKVAGNVYMLHGQDDAKAFSGGNIAVSVGDDGVLMVDSKFAPLSDKIKRRSRAWVETVPNIFSTPTSTLTISPAILPTRTMAPLSDT